MGGDNVGLNIKGLDKNNMPRSGDVMVYKKDTTLGQTREFDAQIQVLDIPNEIKVGYSPIGFVRCGRSACRISKLKWKMGKETGGKKMEDPHSLKSNEMAQCSFQPQQPLVCDTFKNCEGLSRVAFMDGNGGHVGQGHLLRAQGGGCCRRQEEVRVQWVRRACVNLRRMLVASCMQVTAPPPLVVLGSGLYRKMRAWKLVSLCRDAPILQCRL